MQRYGQILRRANFSTKIFVFRCDFLYFVPFLLSLTLQNMYAGRENVTKYVIYAVFLVDHVGSQNVGYSSRPHSMQTFQDVYRVGLLPMEHRHHLAHVFRV